MSNKTCYIVGAGDNCGLGFAVTLGVFDESRDQLQDVLFTSDIGE